MRVLCLKLGTVVGGPLYSLVLTSGIVELSSQLAACLISEKNVDNIAKIRCEAGALMASTSTRLSKIDKIEI